MICAVGAAISNGTGSERLHCACDPGIERERATRRQKPRRKQTYRGSKQVTRLTRSRPGIETSFRKRVRSGLAAVIARLDVFYSQRAEQGAVGAGDDHAGQILLLHSSGDGL